MAGIDTTLAPVVCPERRPGARPPRSRVAALVGILLTGVALTLGAEATRVLVGRNVHEVDPGRAYRCAQQSGAGLKELIQRFGIRTVVNLRGSNVESPWYVEE